MAVAVRPLVPSAHALFETLSSVHIHGPHSHPEHADVVQVDALPHNRFIAEFFPENRMYNTTAYNTLYGQETRDGVKFVLEWKGGRTFRDGRVVPSQPHRFARFYAGGVAKRKDETTYTGELFLLPIETVRLVEGFRDNQWFAHSVDRLLEPHLEALAQEEKHYLRFYRPRRIEFSLYGYDGK